MTNRQRNPMTVRQVFYRLLSTGVIKNTRRAYQSVSKVLLEAQKSGMISWSSNPNRDPAVPCQEARP